MKKTGVLALAVIVLVALAACVSQPSGQADPSFGPTPSFVLPGKADPAPESKPTPKPDKPPRVLLPEDLLCAADATDFVGCPVEVGPDSLSIDEVSGTVSQYYVYDLPKDIDYHQSTVLALLEITQNGLISAEELAAGHDAKWSYESTKKLVENEISSIPGLGEDAFYHNDYSQVHFLFRDYYVIIAFINTKEQYSEAQDLALNKIIAAHVVDALSLADVELS